MTNLKKAWIVSIGVAAFVTAPAFAADTAKAAEAAPPAAEAQPAAAAPVKKAPKLAAAPKPKPKLPVDKILTGEFRLFETGTEEIVDYAKYGTFTGIGTAGYKYKITDRKGLAAALGTGIAPNVSVFKDPLYKALDKNGHLAGSQWDFVNIENRQVSFYKWAGSHDTPGVQQFYTALALEKLGATRQAIKAYYSIVVQYPADVGWTIWHTPLYMGRIALDRIEYLTRTNPDLGFKLEGASIRIEDGYDFDIKNDKFIVDPGTMKKVDPSQVVAPKVDVSSLKIVEVRGQGAIQLVKFENGHWQLRADGKPFMVKAVAYSPTPIGKTPDQGYNLDSWMTNDYNQNGKADGPYDAYVDANANGKQDPDEPAIGDFQLMKEMGVNTIRLYHHPMSKELLRDLYSKYGIRVIIGDLLGMYAVGSGAEWFKGTDYTNPEHLKNMKESVQKVILEYKDEPYVLLWMLGNESNYGEVGDEAKGLGGFGSNARHQPEAHYKFINEMAGFIKELDPNHLVAFSNGDQVTINVLAKNGSNLDIFGTNCYRGESGFGHSLWWETKRVVDKPILITEYGCPAYFEGKPLEYAEETQTKYHKGNWEDILNNSAGSGAGTALGGVAFEYVDEWWKAGHVSKFDPAKHDHLGQFRAAFPDGWMYEEWLGLTSQGEGTDSPYLRRLRKAYYYYKDVWNR